MYRPPGVPLDTDRFLRARYWSIAIDYVRNCTLELICREIRERHVAGDIAELGVYRGDFAVMMHSLLPDRAIHLFDTFVGFDQRDRRADDAKSYVAEFFDFSDTSLHRVKAAFPGDAKVLCHPGWFPDTTSGVSPDTKFALVSLDVDLYDPMLAGLRWFWDRLSPGGFILVHDYNNTTFRGTKAAVSQFLNEVPASCCPVPDVSGSAVIGKPRR
jgi:O-methyltransferase